MMITEMFMVKSQKMGREMKLTVMSTEIHLDETYKEINLKSQGN